MRSTGIVARWLFCLVALAMSTVLSAQAEVKPGMAIVKTIKGTASYMDDFGVSHPLAVGNVLRQGQTIKTGPDSTLDLFLGQNGPGVGLTANSILRLDKLTYEKSALGPIINTKLDLTQGGIFGTVKKLLPLSHYEVKMPRGTAIIRGTVFYINSTTGAVYVESGVVKVQVVLDYSDSSNRQGPFIKEVTIAAGQTLTIPTLLMNPFKLAAVTMTPDDLSMFTKYTTTSEDTVQVTETFDAEKKKNVITITGPPEINVVSP